jgi:hypothetical protein
MKISLLRYLLMMDAAVLFLLGALLIFAPAQVERAFHFQNLPPAVGYMIGLWGCVFATLGIGYVVAATDPLRHIAWVQVGIARGALECALGVVYLARGIVTFQQAGVGIVIAGAMAVAYLVSMQAKSSMNCPHCHTTLPVDFSSARCPSCGRELSPPIFTTPSPELSPPNRAACWLVFWLAFLSGPALAFWALNTNQPQAFFLAAVFGASVSGFALARRFSSTVISFVFTGIGFTFLIAIIYGGVGFVGCLAALSNK